MARGLHRRLPREGHAAPGGQGVRGAGRRRHQLPLQRLSACAARARPAGARRSAIDPLRAALYCGAAAAAERGRGGRRARRPAGAPPRLAARRRARTRRRRATLLVLDLEGADAGALAARAGRLRASRPRSGARRGGWHLHRIVPAADAAAEADRLGRARPARWSSCRDREARCGRARPGRSRGGAGGARAWPCARRGRRSGSARTTCCWWSRAHRPRVPDAGPDAAGAHRDPRAGLPHPPAPPGRSAAARAGPRGLRVRAAVARRSSLLQLLVLDRRRRARRARGRRLPAAGARARPPRPAGGAAGDRGALARAPPRARKEDALVLDNLAQFRFYSAWRGLRAVRRAAR